MTLGHVAPTATAGRAVAAAMNARRASERVMADAPRSVRLRGASTQLFCRLRLAKTSSRPLAKTSVFESRHRTPPSALSRTHSHSPSVDRLVEPRRAVAAEARGAKKGRHSRVDRSSRRPRASSKRQRRDLVNDERRSDTHSGKMADQSDAMKQFQELQVRLRCEPDRRRASRPSSSTPRSRPARYLPSSFQKCPNRRRCSCSPAPAFRLPRSPGQVRRDHAEGQAPDPDHHAARAGHPPFGPDRH